MGRRGNAAVIFLCVGAAALIIAWLSASRALVSLSSSTGWVEHTVRVQSELNLLTADLLESEARWRNFLASGDPQFAHAQAAEKGRIRNEIEKLRAMTADNANEQARLDQLEALRARRRTFLDSAYRLPVLEARRKADVIRTSETESDLLDSLRRTIGAMQEDESTLLIARRRAAAAAYASSRLKLVLGGVVALMLFSLAVASSLIEMVRQQELEAQSRLESRKLQAILDGLGDALIVVDAHRQYIEFNGVARRILGLHEVKPATSLPDLDVEVYAADGLTPVPRTETPLALALRGVSTDRVELWVRDTATDRRTALSVTGRPLPLDGGTGGVIVFRDITVSKNRERELVEQARRLEDLNRQLEAKNREIAAFYHTLSHELKTPLTSAREFIALVHDGFAGSIDAQQREYLMLAKQSCDQMTKYINDLLDSSRLETGKLDVQLEAVEVGPTLEMTAALFRPSMAHRKVALLVNVAPDLPPVRMDGKRVSQVLANLLSNARKYTPAGGDVIVAASLTEDGARVEVSVDNDGPPIGSEHLERIFDRLYQVRTTDSTVEGGLGLGLYICRQVIEAHGGTIHAQNIDPRGVRFAFTLVTATVEPAAAAGRGASSTSDG
jgi:signal transduction histidine kinase/CHASE3 domain sensor protein